MPLDTSNTPKSWSKIGQTTAENMKALQARAKELGEEEALNKAVKNLTRTTAEPKPRPQKPTDVSAQQKKMMDQFMAGIINNKKQLQVL